jgi:hypothetical protein
VLVCFLDSVVAERGGGREGVLMVFFFGLVNRRRGADHSWVDADSKLCVFQTIDQPVQVSRSKTDYR